MNKTRFQFLIIVLVLAVASMAFAENLTRANWVNKVGFAPDLNNLPFKTGDVISASNADKGKAFLPDAIYVMMKKYGLVADVGTYKSVVPSDGYIAATNKNMGKPQLVNTGSSPRTRGLNNYVSGLPFINPKSGTEVAWNYHYSYNGDDAKNFFGVYWISAKRGVEKWEEWDWDYIMRGMNRTDISPFPALTQMAKKGYAYASLTVTLFPPDKRDFSALYYRRHAPKDQEGWIYLPQNRRHQRHTFGTRGDAWNQTDMLYEDVRGYMGYPEWMNWKIVKKTTMYAPVHAGVPLGKDNVKKVWDFETAPHWNPRLKWEPRPMYVVEAIPKFRDYPYSKMVCYIDAESYAMIFKECYDRKGQLWKLIMNITNDSKNPRKEPLAIAGALAVDIQGEHATTFCWYKGRFNVGLTYQDFVPSVLTKRGK